MEQFKLINDESYESLIKYIQKINPIYDFDYPLAFVTIDGKQYMVTKIGDVEGLEDDANRYIIAYDEDNDIKLASYMDDEDAYGVVFGDKAYRVDLNDHAICVEDRNNYFKEMLSYAPDFSENAFPAYNYIQIDPYNRRELYYDYRAENFENPEMVVPFLKARTPKLVELIVYRAFLKHTERYVCEGPKFYPYIRINDKILITIPYTRGKNYNDIAGITTSLGFNSYVPQEVIDVYSGNHKEVNKVKKIADIYKKNTHL